MLSDDDWLSVGDSLTELWPDLNFSSFNAASKFSPKSRVNTTRKYTSPVLRFLST